MAKRIRIVHPPYARPSAPGAHRSAL